MRTLWLLALAACTPMEPSGRPFAPVVPPRAVGPAPAPVVPRGPQGDGSAFDDERTDEPRADAPDADTPVERGDPDDKLAAMARFARSAPAPAPAVAPLPTPPAPVWDPSRPLPEASFGVRVLAVLLDLQPPRAVLGLPDGREQVVTPGAMLPAEGLVVLAIGRDAVQIAHVTPQGYYARVETDTVVALAPGRTLAPSP